MWPEPIALLQSAHAMLVHRPGLLAAVRPVEVFLLVWAEDRRLDVGHNLVEQLRVTSRGNVVVDDQGQEVEIVADPGADADPGRRMPPVLDIALLELPGCRPQDLRRASSGALQVRAMTS